MVVVSLEHIAVVLFQLIACANHFLRVGDAVGITVLAHVGLGIQIQTAECGPHTGFVGVAITVAPSYYRVGKFTFAGQHLTLDILEEVCRQNLLRTVTAHGAVLIDKRHVAVEVERILVHQGSHETGLSAILSHLCLHLLRTTTF